jgi:hypothetical protein
MLNSEPSNIMVSEVHIGGAGYYNIGIPIIHCPHCGAMLKKYTELPKEDA